MTTLVIDESSLRAVRAQLTDEALVVDLVDGRSWALWQNKMRAIAAEGKGTRSERICSLLCKYWPSCKVFWPALTEADRGTGDHEGGLGPRTR
jgi:hypothetical protein